MCTLIVVRNGYPSYPLVVAANRDELIDPPSEPPKFWDGAPRMLAPADSQRGGTWIGVNDRGVFAAVTNRNDVASVRGMASRGDLVLMALSASTAGEAAGTIAKLGARLYNGFHLVIADRRSGYLAYGDGREAAEPRVRLEDLADGLHVISNLGVGPDHAARAHNVMRMWRKARLDKDSPHVSGFDRVLTFHDDERNVRGTATKSMGSVCIHRPSAENYGTKSSAFIRLRTDWNAEPPTWLYRHRERPTDADGKDAGSNCNAGWKPEILLPTVTE
jgi:uncharacterized protein with NRDE domain